MLMALKNFLAGSLLLDTAADRRNYIPLSVSPARVAKNNLNHSWNTVIKRIANVARRKLRETHEAKN